MDWYLDPSQPGSAQRLRAELHDFLFRHSTPDSDVDAALLGSWELISNGLRHAPGPVWVSLDWEREQALIEVHDLGPGFVLEEGLRKQPGPEGGFGLKMAYEVGEELRARPKPGGGVRVSVRLPVFRKADSDLSYYRVEPAAGVPISRNADERGRIGKGPFLLAVAVNLAHTTALREGPEVASALVNEVGSQVGAEIEKAYRQARGIEGPLTTEQMAELFVELKAAIEGDFYVIEATDDRIVLGNRACPFGDAVQQAPSLCQMTSAVFGGIAARNRDGARVLLDERIAVGDPGCRVVVELVGNAKTTGS